MTDLDRQARRKQLLVLLNRAERGVLLEEERLLLLPLAEAVLADADAARRTAGGVTAENRRLRQQVADLTDEAARLRAELAESEQLRQHAGELYLMFREMYYVEAEFVDRHQMAWWSARQCDASSCQYAAVTVPDGLAATPPAQPAATDHACPDGEPCPPHDTPTKAEQSTPTEDDSLDEMTITDDPNDPEQVLVHLPVFGYLDTQAWSVDVGIPRSHLRHLAGLATGTVTTPAPHVCSGCRAVPCSTCPYRPDAGQLDRLASDRRHFNARVVLGWSASSGPEAGR